MEQMVQRRESQTNLGKDMKRAAFRVFSALAATDEDIRKKIIDTDDLMNQVNINTNLSRRWIEHNQFVIRKVIGKILC